MVFTGPVLYLALMSSEIGKLFHDDLFFYTTEIFQPSAPASSTVHLSKRKPQNSGFFFYGHS